MGSYWLQQQVGVLRSYVPLSFFSFLLHEISTYRCVRSTHYWRYGDLLFQQRGMPFTPSLSLTGFISSPVASSFSQRNFLLSLPRPSATMEKKAAIEGEKYLAEPTAVHFLVSFLSVQIFFLFQSLVPIEVEHVRSKFATSLPKSLIGKFRS